MKTRESWSSQTRTAGWLLLCLIPWAVAAQLPPGINGPAAERMALPGTSVLLVPNVSGTPPLSYQWLFNDSSIAGATNQSLLLSNVGVPQNGTYGLIATNNFGAVTGAVAHLTVLSNPPPTVVGGWGLNDAGQVMVPSNLVGVVSLSAGSQHVLALRGDGTVIGWGAGGNQQLNPPAGLSNVVAVAAGGQHSLALKQEGTVLAWGDNSAGQAAVPPGLTNVTAIAAGAFHSLALRNDRTVVAWGNNSYGQTITPPGITNAVAIAAGGYFSLALLSDGRIAAWGFNGNGELNVPSSLTNAIALAAGFSHSLALRLDGTVTAWGYNGSSQTNVPGSLSNVTALAAGYNHSLALKGDGTLLAWGSNSNGQGSPPAALTNVLGIAAGNSFNVRISPAPVIRTQPHDQLLVPGTRTTFSVETASALPVRYQWRFNGTGLPDATDSSLTLTNVQPSAAGSYSVYVTNDYGGICSAAALLSPAPSVLTGPVSQVGQVGRDAVFVVSVASTAPVSYQWQFKGTNIPGATAATCVRSNAQPANVGDYRVLIASSVASATSAPAWLALVSSNRIARLGDSVTLSITSAVPSALQWQFNGTNLLNQTNSSLTLANIQAAQSGTYRVLSNDGQAQLTGPDIAVLVFVPPTLTNPPASQLAIAGANVTFAVGAAGTAPLSYQWRFNNGIIAGATNASCNLANVQFTNAGSYSVSVSNYAGTVNSSNAMLTVNPRAPTILSQPQNRVVIAGTNATFSVLASGVEPLAYQWRWNNTDISGATNAALTLANLQLTNAGAFQVVLSNAEGSVTSSIAVLTVYPGDIGIFVSWGATLPAPPGLCELVAIAPSLVLKRDGKVISWGSGLGTTVPPSIGPLAAIAGTADSAIGLKNDGTVVAWGNDGWGGHYDVPGLATNVVQIVKGNMALRSDGTVVGWGGMFWPLGELLPVSNVVAVAAGSSHWLALRTDGTVAAFGDNSRGQTNVPVGLAGVKAIACGAYHSLALRSNGTVVAWGLNASGQSSVPAGLNGVKAIACGDVHSMALKTNGTVVAWGYNDLGQTNVPPGLSNVIAIAGCYWGSMGLQAVSLGISVQPVGVTNMVGSNVSFSVVAYGSGPLTYQWFRNNVALAGATDSALMLTDIQVADSGFYKVQVSNPAAMCESDTARLVAVPWPFLPFPTGTPSRVVAWGRNLYGETTVPPGLTNVVAISSGSSGLNNFAYTADGRIVRWGGGVGLPGYQSNLVYVASGENFNLGLQNNGTLSIWGNSDYTNLQDGVTGVQAISAGGPKLALRTDGVVLDVGGGAMLNGVSNATAIAAGHGHALALRQDGTLALTKYNDPYSAQTPLPAGVSNVVAIAAGVDHCLALLSNGTVLAWGRNANSQCSVPLGLSNVIAIAAAGNHSLALKSDHTVVPWGDSANGMNQLPTGLTNVVAISCGWDHNVALRAGPVFTRVPANLLTVPGGTVTLSAAADANSPIGWQWLFNGLPISGATNTDLVFPAFQAEQAGEYTVRASADGFSVVASAQLSFGGPPQVLAAPANLWVRPGESALFQVSATNALPLRYQWFYAGQSLPGETNNFLSLTNIQVSQAGDYNVWVATPGNLSTNLKATLFVIPAIRMGTVVAWGSATNTPAGISGVIQVVAGSSTSSALRADGTVVEWTNLTATYNANLTNVTQVVALASGDSHTLGLRRDGTIVGWGSDTSGQADTPNIFDARAIAAGQNFSVAVRSNGTALVWGFYSDALFNVPAQATNLVAVAAGADYVVALRDDHTVTGWGSTTPPAGLSNIVAIAAGHQNSMALRSDGQVACWGMNLFGETNVPSDLSNVVAIATHYGRCLALLSNGTVRGWGNVTPPAYLSNIIGIAAGQSLSLGVAETGVFITRQPRSATVPAGATVTLAVEATGVLPLSYQWTLNGTNLTGAVGPSLTVTNVQDTDGGNYVVNVSTSLGMNPSAPARLTVLAPPRFIVQPSNQAIPSGSNVTFWGQAAGTLPLSYQWFFNGLSLPGMTNTNLTLTNVTALVTNFYQLRVTNAYGAVTSAPAALVVLNPPRILAQPVSQNVLLGSNASFTVSVAGTAPLAYRWWFNEADLPGATESVLLLTNVQSAAAGRYALSITNAYGAVTSVTATLTVLGLAPTVLSSPTNQSVPVGSAASFAVIANGAPPLSFQWRRNGAPLPGRTVPVLNLANVQGSDAGLYDVIVTNSFGATTSGAAQLQIGPNPNVVAWGLNDKGQTNVPASLTNIVAVAADFSHVLALRADGTVTGWGTNDSGQLNIPVGLSNVVAVAAGSSHSLALRADGTVVGWGGNAYGQAVPPAGLSNVTAIAAGSIDSLAVKQDGTVVGWGYNAYGQATPPADLTNAVGVAAGFEHSIGLKQDGTLRAWGNYYGDPAGLSNLVAVSGKGLHFNLLRGDGTVLGWGSKTVEGPPSVVTVSAGGAAISAQPHSLAILANGTLAGWGGNTYGQASPPAGISNVIAISAGYYFSVAVKGGAEFLTQPLSQTVPEGQPVTFSAEFYSFLPTALQWQLNGTNIVGATNSALWLPSAQFAQRGSYTLVASNRFGFVTSAAAVLTVNPVLPVLTILPTNQTVVAGGTAVFNAVAVGAPPLFYQWRFNGMELPGATSATLTLNNVNSNSIGAYAIVVSNPNGSVASAPVGLSVVPAELIVDNAQAQVTGAWLLTTAGTDKYGVDYLYKGQGSGASRVSFAPALTQAGVYQVYEWHPQNASRSSAVPHFVDYDGGSQLILVNQRINGGRWNLLGAFPFTPGSSGRVRISDAFPEGSLTAAADAIRFVYIAPPVILTPLQSRFIMTGGTADFVVTAASTSPLSYSWQKDNNALPWPSLAQLLVTNVQPGDAGLYVVSVRNSGGTATSSATLNVGVPLSLSVAAGTLSLNWAGPFALQTATEVTGPFIDIPGATPPWLIWPTGEPRRFFRLRLAPEPQMSTLTLPRAPGPRLAVTSAAGFQYQLEASTNLMMWTPVARGVAPFEVSDLSWTNFPARFYRAVWVP